jgi:hypothetical protein
MLPSWTPLIYLLTQSILIKIIYNISYHFKVLKKKVLFFDTFIGRKGIY